jgi:hypothetical protein
MSLKRGDFIIIGFILAVLIGWGVFWLMSEDKNAQSVKIMQDGAVIVVLPLNKDAEYDIDSGGRHNRIIIKDRKCHMEEANCPDGLCLKQAEIKSGGQTIVCLPNRVVIEGIGGKSNIDAVTN